MCIYILVFCIGITYVCIYIHAYMHMYVYVRVCIHKYIYTHIYIRANFVCSSAQGCEDMAMARQASLMSTFLAQQVCGS